MARPKNGKSRHVTIFFILMISLSHIHVYLLARAMSNEKKGTRNWCNTCVWFFLVQVQLFDDGVAQVNGWQSQLMIWNFICAKIISRLKVQKWASQIMHKHTHYIPLSQEAIGSKPPHLETSLKVQKLLAFQRNWAEGKRIELERNQYWERAGCIKNNFLHLNDSSRIISPSPLK